MEQGPFELELLEKYGGVCALVAYGNVNITIWYEAGDASAVRAMEAPVPNRLARFPEGVSGVHIIAETAGLPSASARDALVTSARRWADVTAAVAVVIEHKGFGGSAMRSAVTGIQMLAKTPFPLRVTKDLAEASRWLPEPHRARTGVELDSDRLLRALQDARELGITGVPLRERPRISDPG